MTSPDYVRHRRQLYRYGERRETQYPPDVIVDRYIQVGRFDDASNELRRLIKRSSPETSRRMRKLIAIPFYKLEFALKNRLDIDQDLLDSLDDTHGLAGELLEATLANFTLDESKTASKNQGILIGDITETTVLALSARHFLRTGTSFTVPAPDAHDLVGGGYGADFRSLNCVDRTTSFLQVKTRLSRDHIDQYSQSIRLVGMQHIDPVHYRDPSHENSIHQALIRELNGTSTETDEQRLNNAGWHIHKVSHN